MLIAFFASSETLTKTADRPFASLPFFHRELAPADVWGRREFHEIQMFSKTARKTLILKIT